MATVVCKDDLQAYVGALSSFSFGFHAFSVHLDQNQGPFESPLFAVFRFTVKLFPKLCPLFGVFSVVR